MIGRPTSGGAPSRSSWWEAWPDRLRTVAQLEYARTRFEEQRAEQKEIVSADEGDVDVGSVARQLVQVTRCGKPANAATEYDDAFPRVFLTVVFRRHAHVHAMSTADTATMMPLMRGSQWEPEFAFLG